MTVLGRVVYDAHTTIGKALMYYWKLKAIESIETSPSVKLPKDDLAKLVDTLIDNQQIKDIVRNTSNLNDDHLPREVSQDIMTGAKKVHLGELITNKLKCLYTKYWAAIAVLKKNNKPFILYLNIFKRIPAHCRDST